MKFNPRLLAASAFLMLLSACGGGGDGGTAVTPPADPAPPVVAPPVTTPVTPPVTPLEPPAIPPETPPVTPPETPPVTPPETTPEGPPQGWLSLMGSCEHPRPGLGPNGLPYYDRQGSLKDELNFLYGYIDESYLWYRELPKLNLASYTNTLDYFAAMKTPALTASGRAKDRFHFTYPSEVWEAMSGAGVELGYGLTWSRSTNANVPRVWAVTLVEPNSPASAAGLLRGDLLRSVDGVDIGDTSAVGIDALNAGLFPAKAGETHKLVLARGGQSIAVSLTAAKLSLAPVRNVKVIDTAGGKVGYLQFDDHNAVSERPLADAVSTLKAAGVKDLVLDMRYNGGGYLNIASELAYMIAGPAATNGKVFERTLYNDKTAPHTPMPFLSTATGFAPTLIAKGTVLPYLGLKRVTVLTTPGTCSASEALINSLRGVDVEVNLIGGETCGKPYAFVPAANCGTTYFAIQMQGLNNKDFGDYADGFQPTCNVADDLTRPMGDVTEGVLAAALSHLANGVCPASPMRNRSEAGAMRLVRPEVKEISIRSR